MAVDFSSGTLTRATHVPSIVNFTLAVWVYLPTTAGADWTILSIDDGSADFFQFSRYRDMSLIENIAVWSDAHAGGSSGISLITEASAAGHWLFLALVGNTTTSNVYWKLEGAGSLSTTTIESSALTSGGTIWIGDDGFGTGNWPGRITGLKIWDSQLTSTQLLSEAGQQAPIITSALNTYLPLSSATGAGTDQSGNGYNFTSSGSLSTVTSQPSDWPSGGSTIDVDAGTDTPAVSDSTTSGYDIARTAGIYRYQSID